MKIAYRYTILLLIVAFSIKTASAVLIVYAAFAKANTEQQDPDSEEEKVPEKIVQKEKFEAIDLIIMQQWLLAPFTSSSIFYPLLHRSLPSRYSIVPTPPPWFKS